MLEGNLRISAVLVQKKNKQRVFQIEDMVLKEEQPCDILKILH